ncbi:glutamate receptor ionotropic, kainate 5 isoform X1 [Frieseomelitta varia]|uniref:glutamate receptor ionotropic, kainate 5 isoform X1 n=1 Tax=Frieseomelitta varia TaxID=561572 RepID=UPI001CB6AD6E|nr:glutamate receptor ionotropic, kainate 5 isoform X1 [Frieseomelitta varia]XP_043514941.1 glutamate receptor ionotropic, kainate 5 isoform X1 [Frieseomelitta varia]
MRVLCSLLLVALFFIQERTQCVRGEDSISDTNNAEVPLQLTVTSWNDMPFSGIVQENGKWIGKGYAFYIFDLLSLKLNFTYTIVPPKKHILGNKDNGVLSLLYNKTVDVAVAFLPVLPEMGQYCTFSTPLDEMKLTAVMKRPQDSATGSGLLAPFERTVWLLVLASLIFVGPIIYLFANIRAKLWHDPTSENFSLSSCFWFVYSSLLKQGTNIVATTDSTRMLFATWWIFILILTSFYTANLTAFLTKPQFTLSISSLQDIVKKGYSWVTYEGRTIDFLLSQNHQTELSILNATKTPQNFEYHESSKDILQLVSTKRLFLAETHYLQTLIFENYVKKTRQRLDHNLRCTYVIMPGSILTTSRAFGFPLNSTLGKNINLMLLKLLETGIINQKKKEDLPLAEICPVDLRSSERQLRNTDLLLTYKVVVAGYTIAAIIFLFELIYAFISYRMKNSKRRVCLSCCAPKAKAQSFSNNNFSAQNFVTLKRSPPAIYQYPDNVLMQRKQQLINGRSYYVVTNPYGDRKLIPIGTPSAFLFQYAA